MFQPMSRKEHYRSGRGEKKEELRKTGKITLDDEELDPLESLSDDRGFVREEALQKLLSYFTEYNPDEASSIAKDAFQEIARNSFQRGNSKERATACELVANVCISAGEDDKLGDMWEDMEKAFLTLGIPAGLQTGAIYCFVNGGEKDALRYMTQLESFFTRKGDHDSDCIAAAIDAWNFLATCVSPEALSKHITSPEHSNGSLALRRMATRGRTDDDGYQHARVAAVESLALMLEINQELPELEDEDEENEQTARAAAYNETRRAGLSTSPSGPLNMTSVHDTLRAIMDDDNTSGHRVPKGERDWRREVVDTATLALSSAETVAEVIVLPSGEEVSFGGYVEKIQLDVLRNALGASFTHHLAFNPLLRNMFELGEPHEGERLASRTRQQMKKFAADDKNRTRQIAARRRNQEAANESFLS